MDIEKMMLEMMMNKKGLQFTPVTGDELIDLQLSFQPIKDLKPGDRLVWKGEAFIDKKNPKAGEVIEVFRLFDGTKMAREMGNNHSADENDFTAMYKHEDGSYTEFCYDSRRFSRIG